MCGSMRRKPKARLLSRGSSQFTISGITFELSMASPRIGSAWISSLGLKYLSSESNLVLKLKDVLKMNCGSRIRFMMLGAVVADRSRAGLDEALMTRCQVLRGMANRVPGPH